MQKTQITINDLIVKNRKQVDKNCTSADYYFGDKFLFNEVSCQMKNGKTSDYQYFIGDKMGFGPVKYLAQKYNTQIGGDYGSGYYIYFCDFNKALEFINSEDFV